MLCALLLAIITVVNTELIFSVTFVGNEVVCSQCSGPYFDHYRFFVVKLSHLIVVIAVSSATLVADSVEAIPVIEQVQADAYAVSIDGAANAFSRVEIVADHIAGGPTDEFSLAVWVKFDRVSFHRDK